MKIKAYILLIIFSFVGLMLSAQKGNNYKWDDIYWTSNYKKSKDSLTLFGEKAVAGFYETNRQAYIAFVKSSVPLTSDYAKARGADKGLVYYPCNKTHAKSFSINAIDIIAIVRIKFVRQLPEWYDYVYTKNGTYEIYVSASNAGMFISSDVKKKTENCQFTDDAYLIAVQFIENNASEKIKTTNYLLIKKMKIMKRAIFVLLINFAMKNATAQTLITGSDIPNGNYRIQSATSNKFLGVNKNSESSDGALIAFWDTGNAKVSYDFTIENHFNPGTSTVAYYIIKLKDNPSMVYSANNTMENMPIQIFKNSGGINCRWNIYTTLKTGTHYFYSQNKYLNSETSHTTCQRYNLVLLYGTQKSYCIIFQGFS